MLEMERNNARFLHWSGLQITFLAGRYPTAYRKEKPLSLSYCFPKHTEGEESRQCLTVMPNAIDNYKSKPALAAR